MLHKKRGNVKHVILDTRPSQLVNVAQEKQEALTSQVCEVNLRKITTKLSEHSELQLYIYCMLWSSISLLGCDLKQ